MMDMYRWLPAHSERSPPNQTGPLTSSDEKITLIKNAFRFTMSAYVNLCALYGVYLQL
jgi:hypothetical protein